MPINCLADLLADWESLLSAVEDNPCGMNDLDALVSQLESTLADLKTAHTRRSAFQAKASRLTREIQDKMIQGKDLASRIRSWAVARYGRRNEKLEEFGKKPVGRKADTKAPLNPTAP
jgi:hypothetical protein